VGDTGVVSGAATLGATLGLDFSDSNTALDPRITYTGASSRMYFDSTGTLRLAPFNVLLHSQAFDNTAQWTPTRSTVTANAVTAPDGTLTADAIVEDATAANTHDVRSTGAATPNSGTNTWTFSIHAKKANRDWFLVEIQNNAATGNRARAWFDLNTGAVGTGATAGSGVTFVSRSIEDKGNGWYRCILVAAVDSAVANLQTFIEGTTGDSVTNYDGVLAQQSTFVWGAHLNLGTTAFDYIPTTTAAVYLPRSNAYQDHNPATLAPLGFLIEEQRTNSLRNNTMQGAAVGVIGSGGALPTNWFFSVATTTGLTREVVAVGTEDGISYVDLKLSGTASGAGSVSFLFEAATQVVASQNQVWTGAIYRKLVAGSFAGLNASSAALFVNSYTAAGAFDAASTSTARSEATPTSAALRTQRATLTGTLSSATTARVNLGIYLTIADGAAIDITLRIGLPQLELGAFDTSPILTTGAAATRLADVASITGTNFSSFWNASEGTIVARALRGVDSVVTIASASLTNNNENRLEVHATAAAEYRATVRTLNVEVAAINVVSSANQTTTALAYKADDIAFCVNGSAVGTDTSAALPSVAQLNLGIKPNGADVLNGHIQSLTYYRKRLSNLQLQQLTSPVAKIVLNLDFLYAGQTLDSRITYTGASARMYFDSTGTLRLAPQNVLTYSEDFDNAAWSVKTNATLTPGVSDPFGGTAAFTMERTSGASSAVVGQPFTGMSGASYTGAFYVRRRSGSGTVALVVGDNVNQTITLTSEWQRFERTDVTASTTVRCYITLEGAGTDTIDIYGASLNLGTTAFDYIPTTTAAVYLPRSNAYQDHNPSTLAPLGFLIEEQRTNSIRNNTMQGAVAGTPGTLPTNWTVDLSTTGLSREVVGFGVDQGIAYLDYRLFGTAAATNYVALAFETATGVVATTGQAWANSVYVKLQGGTTSGLSILPRAAYNENTSGGVFIRADYGTPVTPTSAWRRATLSTTLSGGGTTARLFPYLYIQVTNGAAIDITLRIGLPQLELGAFATSPILTTAAAATRLADSASMTGTNFSSWFNQTEGTIVSRQTRPATAIADGSIYQIDDGTNNERYSGGTGASGSALNPFVVDGGVGQATLTQAAGTALGSKSLALTYKLSDFAAVTSGAAAVTDVSGTLPTVDRMWIGRNSAGSLWNGHIQSLTYYNKRLPNQTLQSLTV
jgi:hypothetical protein